MRTVHLQPPNLPAIDFSGAFNDLELTIMGLKRPEQGYLDTRGRFYWLTPRLMVGEPAKYHIGMVVAFSRSDFAYFGFYDDHRHLRAEHAETGWRSDIVDIGDQYHPLRGDATR